MATLSPKSSTKNIFKNRFIYVLLACFIVFLAICSYVIFARDQTRYESDLRSAAEAARHRHTYYASVFRDLSTEGVLYSDFNSLFIGEEGGVIALKEIGIVNSTGISSKKFLNGVKAFRNRTFDFEFSSVTGLDRSLKQVQFASEVYRTLKPEGFFVLQTQSAKDEYSLKSLLQLFADFTLVRSRETNGLDFSSVNEIVFKKSNKKTTVFVKTVDGCSVPKHKRDLVKNLEPLIAVEPLKPWITLRRNIRNVRYLSSMVDISFKNRYIYIDVGARSYGSSIGSWFKKLYPKQGKVFEIYAIEADSMFYNEYETKKDVTLLPYAAWVRNETLFFEISRYPTKKNQERGHGMGRIQPAQPSSNYVADSNKIQGFDFALWLTSLVVERDYVVVKIDIEGTEFQLIPRLIETGAICLIDEMFIECHYNRWQRCCPGMRSQKYQKTYSQCLEMLSSLRKIGVLVHQWW